MSEGFSNPIIGGGGALVYPSIHSPNFNVANPPASPSPSWAVLKNGIAYFFGLTLSGGTITGPDYIINTSGAFFYSGTPANGNLIASVTSAPGTDTFGNTYQGGVTAYAGLGAEWLSLAAGQLTFDGGCIITEGPSGGIKIDIASTGQFAVISGIATQLLLSGGAFDVLVPLIATAGTSASPSLVTTDFFHAITLDANWSTLAGQPVPSVQLTADGMVHIIGAIQYNVNISNTNINGGTPLAAAYRPASEIFIAGAPGSAGISIQTNGVIVAAQAPGQTTVFCNFNGRYPLNL